MGVKQCQAFAGVLATPVLLYLNLTLQLHSLRLEDSQIKTEAYNLNNFEDKDRKISKICDPIDHQALFKIRRPNVLAKPSELEVNNMFGAKALDKRQENTVPNSENNASNSQSVN